jgi:hypothetical protein
MLDNLRLFLTITYLVSYRRTPLSDAVRMTYQMFAGSNESPTSVI